jgi:hypothetical protein
MQENRPKKAKKLCVNPMIQEDKMGAWASFKTLDAAPLANTTWSKGKWAKPTLSLSNATFYSEQMNSSLLLVEIPVLIFTRCVGFLSGFKKSKKKSKLEQI